MLTITDLSTDCTLNKAAMSGVSGGSYATDSFYGYFNGSTLDLGTHELLQTQATLVDQTGATGGFNVVDSSQVQNGVSGSFVTKGVL